MRCWKFILCLVCTSVVAAPTILSTATPARLYPALLQNSTEIATSGVNLNSILADDHSGGDGVALTGAFPLFSVTGPRDSGWSWGFGIGFTSFSYAEGLLLNPSTYFGELMLGRGTSDVFGDDGSGLRGYFEVAFRDQRVVNSNDLQEALTEIGRTLRSNTTSVVIRFGAGYDLQGKGLVNQVPPLVGTTINGAFYIPLSNQRFQMIFRHKALCIVFLRTWPVVYRPNIFI